MHSLARPVPGKGARQGGSCWAGGEEREGWVVQGNGDLAGELAAAGQWHGPLPEEGALLMGARWHCPSGPHRGSLRSEATSTALSAGWKPPALAPSPKQLHGVPAAGGPPHPARAALARGAAVSPARGTLPDGLQHRRHCQRLAAGGGLRGSAGMSGTGDRWSVSLREPHAPWPCPPAACGDLGQLSGRRAGGRGDKPRGQPRAAILVQGQPWP